MWRNDGRQLRPQEVNKRAGGRRHYNSMRQFRAAARRQQVAQLMGSATSRVEMAKLLAVHVSTIARDVRWLLHADPGACPTCGRPCEPEC